MVLLLSKVEIATRLLPVSFITMCNSLHNRHPITRISYPTTARMWFAGYFIRMNIVVWDHVEELLTSRAIHSSRHWILHCSAIYSHRLYHVCKNPMVSMLSTLERCHQRAWAWISNLTVSLLLAIVSLRSFIPVSPSIFLTTHHSSTDSHYSYIVSRRRFRFRVRGLESKCFLWFPTQYPIHLHLFDAVLPCSYRIYSLASFNL